jgi:hypothetical protein
MGSGPYPQGLTHLPAGQILAMVSYAHPSYEPKKVHLGRQLLSPRRVRADQHLWDQVGAKAVHDLTHQSDAPAADLLPLFFIAGFFIWLIVPVAVSPQHATPKQVFTTVFNKSGW